MTTNGMTVEIFEYPMCSGAAGDDSDRLWGDAGGNNEECHRGSVRTSEPDAEARLDAETQRAFERGREQGTKEERDRQAAAHAAEEQRGQKELSLRLLQFAAEREEFFHGIEKEVVKLSLAIAARIMRREAQMDPLLLTGAVRVALGQLSDASPVRLMVPQEQLGLWKETIAHLPNLAAKPEVMVGEGMRMGECALQANVGSVDLGIRSQLREIERGFFDRPSTAGDTTEKSQSRVMCEPYSEDAN